MKRFLYFVFGIGLFVLMSVAVSAASITYCLETSGTTCTKKATGLGDFLNNMNATFYPALGYYADSDWVYFRDSNFEYFIPTEIIEDYLIDGGASGVFTYNSWLEFDENRNKILDDFDDAAESFKKVSDKYFDSTSSYKFDRWWENKLSVIFRYLQEDGFLGYFTVDPDIGPYLAVDPRQTKYALQATIAHEAFHAVQYGYLGDYMGEEGKYDNFIEGTAVLMQSQIVTWEKGFLGFLENSPALEPEQSIFGPSDHGDIANYGSFVWYTFLHKKYGRGIVKDLLEAYADVSATDSIYRSFVAVDNALRDRGTNIAEAFLEYATWNYDKTKYTDGKYYKDVKILKKHKSFPVAKTTISDAEAPHFFASNYIEFDVNNRDSNLDVNFTANSVADMYLTFLSVDGSKVDYSNVVSYLVERGKSKTFTIPSSGKYDKIVMIVSVVNIDGSNYNVFKEKTYSYSYSAERTDAVKEQAESESMENVDLTDYFIFEPGAYWKYELATKLSDGSKEEQVLEYETKQCTSKSGCITYSSSEKDRSVSYHLFSDSVYGYEVNGKAVEQARVFSKKTISQVLKKESYPIWGIDQWGDVFLQASHSCSFKFLDNYTYGPLTDSAVEESCTISMVDTTGNNFIIKEVNHYMKDVGLTDSVSDVTYDGQFFASSEDYLVDTNLAEGDLSDAASVDDFSDVGVSNKNRTAILYLKRQGIINGYPDGTFQPERTVNRAELLKILVEGKGVSPSVSEYNNCFSDVKSEWFAPYVCYAKAQGWVSGYSDGTFKPAQTVNKVESLKMLLNSQGVATGSVSVKPFSDVGVGDWFAPFVAKAKEMGILEETGTTFSGASGMKRAGISENLYRLLLAE